MGKSNEIKDSLLDINNFCEHRKDCAHPHCDCGLSPGCSNLIGKLNLSNCEELPDRKAITIEDLQELELMFESGAMKDRAFSYGPLARYNSLIAKRNRKVEQGIPLH